MIETADAREQQARLYGAPLADLVGEVMTSLSLTQRRVAEVLGLSAPMLSQLMSAKRVKIGNPAVVARLQALLDLAGQDAPLDADALAARLDEVQASSPTLSTTRVVSPVDAAVALAAVATPDELREAASRLADLPRLADLLRAAAAGSGGRG